MYLRATTHHTHSVNRSSPTQRWSGPVQLGRTTRGLASVASPAPSPSVYFHNAPGDVNGVLVTFKEKVKAARRLQEGTLVKAGGGPQGSRRRLTAPEIDEINRLRHESLFYWTRKKLAKRFHVSKKVITHVAAPIKYKRQEEYNFIQARRAARPVKDRAANQARLEAWFRDQWANIPTHRVTRRAWSWRKSYAMQEMDWGFRAEVMTRLDAAHDMAEKVKANRKHKGPVQDEDK